MKPYANAWRTGPDHHDKWTSTALIIELNYARGNYAGHNIKLLLNTIILVAT